ncbi:MAG: hypothetical protein B7Y88_05620 [Sphingomonadales bacterium 32-64-17]|nr:MAG: hypothetical protein B7Y88_05620 [Sphingomonadales bacterium 32-64-17]
MTDTRYWEIDRLAATSLLGRLGIETNPTTVEQAAAAFAEHRMEVQQWTANRVQSRIIGALEAQSMQDFGQKDSTWADGFIAAEQLVARLSTNELLDQPNGTAQSKGQVLRSLVRGARQRSTFVERHSE